jgi:hypothetical protein
MRDPVTLKSAIKIPLYPEKIKKHRPVISGFQKCAQPGYKIVNQINYLSGFLKSQIHDVYKSSPDDPAGEWIRNWYFRPEQG